MKIAEFTEKKNGFLFTKIGVYNKHIHIHI